MPEGQGVGEREVLGQKYPRGHRRAAAVPLLSQKVPKGQLWQVTLEVAFVAALNIPRGQGVGALKRRLGSQ